MHPTREAGTGTAAELAGRALRPLGPLLARHGLWLGLAVVGDPVAVAAGPGELRLAQGMSVTRRRDFLAGRCAARRALAAAGLPGGEILRHGRRPLLPPGSTGSISHSGGLAVALVADRARYRALGCDLELRGLPLDAAHLVLGADERLWTAGAPDRAACEQRLLAAFSAKEAALKAFTALLPNADAPTTLLAVTTRPAPWGFRARPVHPRAAAAEAAVRVRRAGPGVFSWTAVVA